MRLLLNYQSLLQNKQRTIRVAVIILLILASLFLFLFQTGEDKAKEASIQTEAEDLSDIKTDIPSGYIIVDVSGEVQKPAVIELPIDSRINDAILAAGGLTKNADITLINRAAPLADGEKIFIPTKQKADGINGNDDFSGNITKGYESNPSSQNEKININLAEAAKLQEIPGIGPVTAEKIISYRAEHGLFRKIEELKKVSGIGDKTFEKMQPYICI